VCAVRCFVLSSSLLSCEIHVIIIMLGKRVVMIGDCHAVRRYGVVATCRKWSVTPRVDLAVPYQRCEFGVAPGCALHTDASQLH